MPRSNIESIILYGGAILLGYYILSSWGVIRTMSSTKSMSNNNIFTWKPLTEQQVLSIRNYIDNYRPIDIVRRA